MNNISKKSLRNVFKNKRENLSLDFQNKASLIIIKKIKELSIYNNANNIALYYPFKNEVNLLALFFEEYKKNFYFPVLDGNDKLLFYSANENTTFIINKFGINEPELSCQKSIDYSILDLIFIPVLAFDNSGARLGMGKGYYDRTLPNCINAKKIGVAYECQYYSQLPIDDWDVPLDAIITEKKIYKVN